MKNNKRGLLIGLCAVAALITINFAPMLSPKTPGMRERTSHGITVWATDQDQDEVERIAGRIASRSEAVAASLQGVDAHGVEVIIYPNRGALHRKTIGLAGVLLPDWFIGDNTRRYVLITSPATPGPVHSRESIEQAAVHEYVHVMTDRTNKALGYWMKEGIALYLAEQTPTLGDIRSNSDLTYAEFANPSAIQFAEVGGYSLAYTLIEYIIEEYGWNSVIDLIDVDASYKSVIGLSERELYEEWIAEVRAM
jgi:hypothetical protein